MDFPAVIQPLDISGALQDFLRTHEYDKVICLADSNTMKACFPLLQYECHCMVIPSGETHKTFAGAELVLSDMVHHKLTRQSLLINLGGGVVSDLGGFCASVYQRGIDYINIPTTLLAMADASVGGKTGVDFKHLKNYIGTVYQPRAVFIDPVFLTTLPVPEYISGWAEIVKHLLVFSPDAWLALCTSAEGLYPKDIRSVLAEATRLKATVVEKDPFDLAERRLLNFGHTIGHAIESFFLSKGTPVLHGEAIAAGMICESYISAKQSGLPAADHEHIRKFISAHFPKLSFNSDDIKTISALAGADKKNNGHGIRMVLLKQIGNAVYNIPADETVIMESLSHYLDHEM